MAPRSTTSATARSRPRFTGAVQQNAATFFEQAEAAGGAGLPQFVKDEFDAFLDCGILADGLSNRRVWASLKDAMVAPDGICADAKGGIWVANALAPVVIRVEDGGAITDTVTTSQNAYACALGGPEGRLLLICTAPTSVHSLAAAEANGRLEMVEV